MTIDDGPQPKVPVKCPVCHRPVPLCEGIGPGVPKRRDDLVRFGCQQLALCRDLEAFQAIQQWFLRNDLIDRG